MDSTILENIVEDDIIIDSTASSIVFNHLNDLNLKSRVIKTTLFNNGEIGVIFIEAESRKVKLIDLYAFLFYICTQNPELAKRLNSSNTSYQAVGQGCGSFTTVCTDASISLHAAAMSNIIQNKISNGLKKEAEIYIGISDLNINLNWDSLDLDNIEVLSVKEHFGDDWDVRILPGIKERMRDECKRYIPKETGGIVLGHISMALKTFVVTDIVHDIEGSKHDTYCYINGTKGLREHIHEIEYLSGEKITMLGTWHTHPMGGEPSVRDHITKKEMLKDRDFVPTVCLLYSNDNIIAF